MGHRVERLELRVERLELRERLEFLQQAGDAHLVFDDVTEFADGYTLLLHRVTMTKGHHTVVERIVVNGDAVRRADGILTTIALADRILLLVVGVEVEAQVVDNLASLLRQTVFLHQWQHGTLHGRQRLW